MPIKNSTIPKLLPHLSEKQLKAFQEKIRKCKPDDCWPWIGSRNPQTHYGEFVITTKGKRSHFLAHRIAYFLATGDDPLCLFVCHKCDNPFCCNPSHLFLGTSAENTADSTRKGRRAKGDRLKPETHPKGSKHWAAKLSEEDVRMIRGALSVYFNQRILAEMYGVSLSLIKKIKSRTIWKSVE